MPFEAARSFRTDTHNPFSKFSYFADASAEEIGYLNEIRTIHQFTDGQTLPLSINGRDGFYYIHSGYTKIIYRRFDEVETIRIAGPYDLVGYARWFNSISNYQMVTLSSVTASFFGRDDFLALQYRSAYLANEVVRWLMDILTSQEQRIFSLKGRTAKGRVAGTLDILRQRFGTSIGGNNSIVSAPIDRKTLADLSGVAVEVLSRVLSELESENIISRQGRIIIIVDVKGLERIVRS